MMILLLDGPALRRFEQAMEEHGANFHRISQDMSGSADLGRDFATGELVLFFYTKFKKTAAHRRWRCSGRRRQDKRVYGSGMENLYT